MFDFQVAKAKKSMLHSEVALARWVTQEGRGLVVVVNKMDLLKGKEQAELRNKVMKAVPEEVNNILPQVCFNEVHLDMIETFLRSNALHNFRIFGTHMVLVCLVLQYVHCSAMNLIIMQGHIFPDVLLRACIGCTFLKSQLLFVAYFFNFGCASLGIFLGLQSVG